MPKGSEQALGAEAVAFRVAAVARPAARLDQSELIARPGPHHPFRPFDNRQVVCLERSRPPGIPPILAGGSSGCGVLVAPAGPSGRIARGPGRERVVRQPHRWSLILIAPAEFGQQSKDRGTAPAGPAGRGPMCPYAEASSPALRSDAEPSGVV